MSQTPRTYCFPNSLVHTLPSLPTVTAHAWTLTGLVISWHTDVPPFAWIPSFSYPPTSITRALLTCTFYALSLSVGCYPKLPCISGDFHKRHLLLTVLWTGKSRIEVPTDSGSTETWCADGCILAVSFPTGERDPLSPVSPVSSSSPFFLCLFL